MIDPASAVPQLLNQTLDRAVAQQPSLIQRAVNKSVKNEARGLLKLGPMERQVRLHGLLGIFPDAVLPDLDERLRGAINSERKRGTAGHWAYDSNRHIALRGHLLARRIEL